VKIKIETSDRAILQSKRTAEVINVAMRLEGHRKWLKAGGLRFTPSRHNLDIINSNLRISSTEDMRVRKKPATDTTAMFDVGLRPEAPSSARDSHAAPLQSCDWVPHPRYTPKLPLFPHQTPIAIKMREKGSFALFMEQGTGKTCVALNRIGELSFDSGITGCLIVSKKGVHTQWVKEQIPMHFSLDNRAVAWPKVINDNVPRNKFEFFAINIDGVRGKNGFKACQEFISRHKGRVVMVVDESQTIMNTRSARWKACNKLGHTCLYRFILTGTPIASILEQEWAQLKFMDEDIVGIRYVTSFRAEYSIMGGFEGKQVVGTRNLDKWKRLTDPHCSRVEKSALGIGPKLFSAWEFELLPEQKKLIKQIKTLGECVVSGQVIECATGADAMNKIQQVSNGWINGGDDVGIIEIVPREKNPRLNSLKDICEGKQGRFITWAKYRHDFVLISWLLESIGEKFATYHGGTSTKDREAAVDNFKSGEIRILCANAVSAGTGLNLQAGGPFNVYFSNTDNSIDRWQSEDRTHRIGTTGSVEYFDLIAVGSADKAIRRRHNKKKDFSDLRFDLSQIAVEIDTAESFSAAEINAQLGAF